ncbi:Ohr subfamily peroxiredoxin [Novosphingobium sp. PhB57]|jgi:Ohr subfamily peroxiredoxin|uniref:organic hydroperoxide resistance protein n=1 Tax=unclassified Novosphingobium TaxID=2644732 RepID=UPI00104DA4DF|nr:MULTISPECIES: organic hydroperoxide resistance protein [unclassified Novosphingobium]TCU58877.1 Ohr subfamily peroxiredoxin [Novosphingobium sp. PhB57]TDW61882.1 Ohr subfamily peroxiredoxin [Novosphingobium sp. PhB55]
MSDIKTLYTAEVHVTGGREGKARSSDGRLDIALSTPGTAGQGTNPEQLFAAGWSACFEGAMGIAAATRGVTLPSDLSIDAHVELRHGPDGYALAARLDVHVPGLEPDLARQIIEAAHRTCPYSKAVKGNIDTVVALA